MHALRSGGCAASTRGELAPPWTPQLPEGPKATKTRVQRGSVVNRSSPDDTFLPTCAYAIVKDRKVKIPGGADRDRTDDIQLAKLALSQLSYGPFSSDIYGDMMSRGAAIRVP